MEAVPAARSALSDAAPNEAPMEATMKSTKQMPMELPGRGTSTGCGRPVQQMADKSVLWRRVQWIVFTVLVVLLMLGVCFQQDYVLAIYILNQLLLLLSPVTEALSMVWMELAMFLVAGVFYMAYAGYPRFGTQPAAEEKIRSPERPQPQAAPPGRQAKEPSETSGHRGKAQQHAGTSSSEPAARHAPTAKAGARDRDADGAKAKEAGDQGHRGKAHHSGSSSELSRHVTTIKACARDRDIDGAKAAFARLKSSGVQLTPLACNCFLDALVQCGDIDGAIAHFSQMKTLNFVDVVGYNTVLKAYLARGWMEDARSLMKEMAARGLHANKVTYNELLHSKVMARDLRGTWMLLDEMKEVGVKANSVTCSILLKSLTIQSHWRDVKRVMDTIDDVEEPIDEVLFSSVIEACIRIKQLDLLSDLMRRYRLKGGFVHLTAPTYGSMIKAYGQAGDILRVRELWVEMEERGVKPTSITLGCMAEALVTNNQPEEAWELVHDQLESEERRGCINTVIYSTVLKGFAVAKRIDRVFAVYKEMRSKGVPCNTITYNTMLDACAKCCAMDRASGLLVDMKESLVEPDIITYSTIVKGYCLEGDVDRAFSVLAEMRSDDKFVADEIMYNSILDGCAKQHRVEDALRVLDEMTAAGVGPSNYTLSILVKLLGHARRLTQAFRMVEDLSQKNGFRPNVQVYTCLVQACILNRRLERALQLHNTIISESGCDVDEKFYAVLVRGCLQLHQPMKAVDVIKAAYQLPNSTLTLSSRSKIIGVESRALEEVANRLQRGGKEEQEELTALTATLREQRGIHIGARASGGQAPSEARTRKRR